MAPAFGVAAPSRNLNLRLPGRAPLADLAGMEETGAVAWEIHGSPRQALRAAHAATWDASVTAQAFEVPSRLIVVGVRVGRKPPMRILTNARTVGGLIQALDLGRKSRVETQPNEGTALQAHETVRVTTVRRVRRTEVQDVPFQTLIHYSRDIAAGEVRVDQAGSVGKARRTFLITFRNGTRASTKLVGETILVPPVDRIELRGAAVSGLETGDATWYGCDGMHAAHKTLPFGTLVTVTNLDNGATVAVTINDRGPFAEGRIIDLCDGAFAQIAPLGQGVAHVKITW